MPDTELAQDVNVENVTEEEIKPVINKDEIEEESSVESEDAIVEEVGDEQSDVVQVEAIDEAADVNADEQSNDVENEQEDAVEGNQDEQIAEENTNTSIEQDSVAIEAVDEQEAPINTIVPEKELVEEEEEEDEEAVREAFIKQKKTKFERQRLIKKIVSTVVTSLVWIVGSLLLLLCASNLYQQFFNPGGYTGFFGIGEAVVASRSMEPMLYENDLIFYRSVESENVKPQDVIVYQKTDGSSGETILIVHEVQQIGDGYVITKGINNAVEDEAFPTSAIVGKYMFKVSQAGKLLGMLTTVWAPILIILLIVVVFALRILYYIIYKKKTIEKISTNEQTRVAIDHFFEI